MTGQAATVTAVDSRVGRYREAERALWSHYGIDPTERALELASFGTAVRVVEAGTGRPILFVPGTPGTGPYWGGLVRELQGFRCLMVDRPGWGLSAPIDYRARDYGSLIGDIIHEVVDGLGLDRVDVVGHSIGNVWALRFALNHPSRVGRVALIGGGPVVSAVPAPPFIKLLASPIGALLVRLPLTADRVRSLLRESGHGPTLDAGRIPDAFVDWRVAFQRDTNSMRHERDMVRSLVGRHGWRPGLTLDAELSAIRQSVLWIYGSVDPVGSVELWRQAVGRMPNAELTVVDGCGHLPWLDDPGAVARAIAGFISSPGQS